MSFNILPKILNKEGTKNPLFFYFNLFYNKVCILNKLYLNLTHTNQLKKKQSWQKQSNKHLSKSQS
jgi:hypothetical protein